MDNRKSTREYYAAIAEEEQIGCGCGGADCGCGGAGSDYSAQELRSIPQGADMGLGCGNPTAIAELRPGEVVVDIGAGGGKDCFLAAQRVGPNGRVIGIDMTPQMLERARSAAERGNYTNVEFRLGEIENLPIADSSVDVIISNCVINLSPDKPRVFAEIARVLRPSGRISISDIVSSRPLPKKIAASSRALSMCIGGAIPREDYLEQLRRAGFGDLHIEETHRMDTEQWSEHTLESEGLSQSDLDSAHSALESITIRARKTAFHVRSETVAQWRDELDNLARQGGVKAALIMESLPDSMRVIAANGDQHYYKNGDASLKSISPAIHKLYCEQVVRTGRELFISDAKNDKEWYQNEDLLEYGLGTYLGLPIYSGDRVVGTVCALHDSLFSIAEGSPLRAGLVKLRQTIEQDIM